MRQSVRISETQPSIMRKLLNTLYVTTPDAYLSKDGLNIVVSVNQQEIFRVPSVNIEGIVTFGYMGASPGLMKLCSDNGISLTFMSPNGRFVSRGSGTCETGIQSPISYKDRTADD